MKRRKEYRYFISYHFKDKNGSGFGCTFITSDFKMNTTERIVDIQNYIEENQKMEVLVILNFKRIKKTYEEVKE